MKNKEQITITLKRFIPILLVIGIISVAVSFIGKAMDKNISDTIDIETYGNKDYFIIKDDYSGKYNLQFIDLTDYSNADLSSNFEKKEVMSYDEYKSYCNEWGLKKVYFDKSKDYIVFSYVGYGNPNLDARLAGVQYDANNVDLYIWDHASGVTADNSAYCIVIPTEKEVDSINIIGVYTNTEFNNIKKHGTPFNPGDIIFEKPVIYLYPTNEIETSVKLLNEERLTCSYPKYVDGWNVVAKPNGNLVDLNTGRQLYSLYYESESIYKFNVSKEGFVVKGEDSAKFLEEKLAVLGLTERETEEFIIYWLPKLESNKYNYIRFATDKEINNNMPLAISPNPDTIIRILMIFRGLERPIEVEEQELVTPERIGFTVVEWGGTEIK